MARLWNQGKITVAGPGFCDALDAGSWKSAQIIDVENQADAVSPRHESILLSCEFLHLLSQSIDLSAHFVNLTE